jgi:hypothetical protein
LAENSTKTARKPKSRAPTDPRGLGRKTPGALS